MTAEAGKSAAIKMCLACNREYGAELVTCPEDGTTLMVLRSRDEWIGETLADRYQVTELIGKGGMGVVYLGRHTRMDRLVAVKMLQAQLAQDDVSVKRFEQEARAASCLNHPHLITLHDFGIAPGGQPFLVMEFLEGRSLLEIIKLDGPVAPPRAVEIFSQAAEGLSHAHHQGIVHRDLKPSNILLIDRNGDSDFVKIVDFGLAKLMPWSGKQSQHLTKTGEVFGSPIYMSPEQCMGRELRPTSDIYSLCITLYEALVGKPPFRGPNSIQTASLHMHASPPGFDEVRPDLCLPHSLESVVLKGLQKDPGERFQSMLEFSDALQSALKSAPGTSSLIGSSQAAKIDSTTTIPKLQLQQDKLRPPQQQSAKTSVLPGGQTMLRLLLGSAALAALATGAYWYTHSPSRVVSGVLYFIDTRAPSCCAEIADRQAHIERYALSEQALAKLNDDKFGKTIENSALGAFVQAEMPVWSQQIQSLSRQTDKDSRISKACQSINSLLEGACEGEVAADAIKNDQVNLKRAFAQGTPIELLNPIHNTSGTVPYRSAAALKILKADNAGTTVLVDASLFLKNLHAYWQFNVDANGNIISLSLADQRLWNRLAKNG